MRFDPYRRAVAALREGDVVVCVPIKDPAGEPTWAVAGYSPLFFDGTEPMDQLALHLMRDVRRHLRDHGVHVVPEES